VAQGFQRPGGKIVDREDDYRRRRLNRIISPTRNDAFAMGDKTPDASVRTFADVMREQQLARERDNTLKNIADKRREEEEELAMDRDKPTKASGLAAPAPPAPAPAPVPAPAPAPAAAGGKRRNRWDQSGGGDPCAAPAGPGPARRSARAQRGQPVQRPILLAEACKLLQVLTLGGTAHARWRVRPCVICFCWAPSARQPQPDARAHVLRQQEGAHVVGRAGGDAGAGALGRHARALGRDAGARGRYGRDARAQRRDAGRRQPLGRHANAGPRGLGGHAAAQPLGRRDAHARPGARALSPRSEGSAAARPRCGVPFAAVLVSGVLLFLLRYPVMVRAARQTCCSVLAAPGCRAASRH